MYQYLPSYLPPGSIVPLSAGTSTVNEVRLFKGGIVLSETHPVRMSSVRGPPSSIPHGPVPPGRHGRLQRGEELGSAVIRVGFGNFFLPVRGHGAKDRNGPCRIPRRRKCANPHHASQSLVLHLASLPLDSRRGMRGGIIRYSISHITKSTGPGDRKWEGASQYWTGLDRTVLYIRYTSFGNDDFLLLTEVVPSQP